MFVPGALDARSVQVGPQACRPFSIHSNVCIGDMIAIIACSIAGVGFFFWGIHAIRKMRQDPFNHEDEDKEEPTGEGDRAGPYHVPSAFDNSLLVQNGVTQTLSLPERVRTRLALSEPEEPFYRRPAPISTEAYYAQGSVTTPRMPPRAGGQSQRTSSRRSSRHVSPMRGGPYERNEYGMNDECNVYDEYMRNISPSRARGSPPHRSGTGHRSHQSMRRVNEDHMMYAYAY